MPESGHRDADYDVDHHADDLYHYGEFHPAELEVGEERQHRVERRYHYDHDEESDPCKFRMRHKLQEQEEIDAYQHYHDDRHQAHGQVFFRFAEFHEHEHRKRDHAEERAAHQNEPCEPPGVRDEETDQQIDDDEGEHRAHSAYRAEQRVTLRVGDLVFLLVESGESRLEIAELLYAHVVDEILVVNAFDAQFLCAVHELLEHLFAVLRRRHGGTDGSELLFEIPFETFFHTILRRDYFRILRDAETRPPPLLTFI